MHKDNLFSCILIGENSLVIECGKILLEKKWKISAIVSKVKDVVNWGNENNLRIIKPDKIADLSAEKVDFTGLRTL